MPGERQIDVNHDRRAPFSRTLKRLMDESNLFSRSEWADFLSVTEAAISQWLHDKTLPRPELLRQILRVLHESDNVPRGILDSFWRMAAMPANAVTPLTVRGVQSIAEYLLKPLREEFLNQLSLLSPGEQDGVLRIAASLCYHRVVGNHMFERTLTGHFDALVRGLGALELPERKLALADAASSIEAKATAAANHEFHQSPSGVAMPTDHCEQSFGLFNGAVRRVDNARVRQPIDLDSRNSAATLRQLCLRRPRYKARTSESHYGSIGLAAADPLRKGTAHSIDPLPTGSSGANDMRFPEQADCCRFRGDQFNVFVIVNPSNGRNFDVETLVVDAELAPVSDVQVRWKYQERTGEARVLSGHAWITTCPPGDLELTVLVPNRAQLTAALRFQS